MDVRIGYSVDLDKVPEKIADMLNEISLHKAGHLIELAMHMIELGHHDMGLSLIDDSRKALSEIDRSLNEAHSILTGFNSAKKTIDSQEPIAEASTNSGEENAD